MRLQDIKETASAGGTSSGNVAVAVKPIGGMQKRGIYKEDDYDFQGSTEGIVSNAYSFMSNMNKNPHFVKFHELNASSGGYTATIELDDGNMYDMELKIRSK